MTSLPQSDTIHSGAYGRGIDGIWVLFQITPWSFYGKLGSHDEIFCTGNHTEWLNTQWKNARYPYLN